AAGEVPPLRPAGRGLAGAGDREAAGRVERRGGGGIGFADASAKRRQSKALVSDASQKRPACHGGHHAEGRTAAPGRDRGRARDRKSTRLNSSHANISYAV